MNVGLSLFALLLDFFDQSGERFSSAYDPGSVDQQRRRKACSQVLIKHSAHSSGKLKAGEKILVNSLSADNVKRLVSDPYLPHGGKRELCAVGQFLGF